MAFSMVSWPLSRKVYIDIKDMKPANERVAKSLDRFDIEFKIRLLSAAVRTAQLAAEALGCRVGQIANSLIFRNIESDQATIIKPCDH